MRSSGLAEMRAPGTLCSPPSPPYLSAARGREREIAMSLFGPGNAPQTGVKLSGDSNGGREVTSEEGERIWEYPTVCAEAEGKTSAEDCPSLSNCPS